MLKNACDYKWSSAFLHAAVETKGILKLREILDIESLDWKKYLTEEDEEMVDEMRLKTKRGMVIGTKSFIKNLEKKLKRSLKCLNPGRPKKA